MTKPVPKYVVYYRVSTRRQGRSGLGLKGQQNAVHAFLDGSKSRIVAEYTEIESGRRGTTAPSSEKPSNRRRRAMPRCWWPSLTGYRETCIL